MQLVNERGRLIPESALIFPTPHAVLRLRHLKAQKAQRRGYRARARHPQIHSTSLRARQNVDDALIE